MPVVKRNIPSAPIPPKSIVTKNLVDLNSLSAEDLEQLLAEKKLDAVANQKRAQLDVMSKEDLIQMIIDNQIEF